RSAPPFSGRPGAAFDLLRLSFYEAPVRNAAEGRGSEGSRRCGRHRRRARQRPRSERRRSGGTVSYRDRWERPGEGEVLRRPRGGENDALRGDRGPGGDGPPVAA